MAAERAEPKLATGGSTDADGRMVVVTPTYAPDLELFADLHESVLQCFPETVRHLVIVNEGDIHLFRRFEGSRCVIVGVRDVLPGSVVRLPFSKLWLNLRHPVPPLRGWILQQLVKLAIGEQLDERVIVLADSDLVFIRPVTVETFTPGGRVRLYRLDHGIDESLTRHVRWHAVSHELVGLPAPPPPPLPDYVSSLNTWDRDVVRRMVRRVEDLAGRRWLERVGKELHFSEWTLYGVYADQCEGAQGVTLTSESLCHSVWGTDPLTVDGAAAELASVGPHDVAYMIGSKTRTPLSVRREAHARIFTS